MSKHKHYPPRVPRPARGIRSQDVRNALTPNWWIRRWQERIEAMGLGARLGRGKVYATGGQVVDFAFVPDPTRAGRPNRVVASVLGARPDPYRVTVDFRSPPEDVRAQVVAALRAEPILVARLLSDDLPLEVEEVFRAHGLTLFPAGTLAPRVYDMTTACSCPDYANPCKHSAAVLILLGEEISRRPMTLLELRGIHLEDLCDED